MGLETGNFISDLVSSNPVGATDTKAQGDDHLRLIKSVLQATFPNASRAFRFEVAGAAKTANYTVLVTDQRALITFDATSGNLTAAITAIANLFAGWLVTVMKVDSSANTVTVDPNGAETINGQTTYVLTEQYEFVTLMVQGSEFKIVGVGNDLVFGTASGNVPILGADGLDSAIHGSAVPIGVMLDYFNATPPTGWKGLLGQTLGSAASAATDNSDANEALFKFLWNALANAQAPVSSGRGASAQADWDANKTITVPDTRSRMFVGAGAAPTLTENVTAANVSAANDTFAVVSNTDKWITGMKVQVSTGGTLPAGLSAATDYYVIRDDATTIRLASSLANAVAGTDIDLTDAGSGTHTLEHTLTARTTGVVGGEETHANTIGETPSHTHGIASGTQASSAGASVFTVGTNTSAFSTATGGDSPHNNMPPYIVAYKIIRA